jgi:peptidoglycan hydrolase CwlO-like protein
VKEPAPFWKNARPFSKAGKVCLSVQPGVKSTHTCASLITQTTEMNEDTTERLPNSEDDRLGQILSAVQNLSSRVEGLDRKVEERLYDTRPIWEKVQADIAGLQERMEALRDEMRTGFRDLKRQFSVLNDIFLEARADYKDLDKRVYHLETERSEA